MKRSAVVICVFLVFAACIWAEAQEITIGVNFSTTGPSASLGVPNQNAMVLAPHVIGGQKVHYVFLDDASDPTLALQNVKRLISQDNIDVLIGPSVTPTTLAVIETIATSKVPMITFGSTSRLVLPMDEKKRWVFKTTPNDDIFCTALIN
jgi:branched-chain amino acid transport system substrate-binding protein